MLVARALTHEPGDISPAGFPQYFYPYRPDLAADDPIVSDLLPPVGPPSGGQA
jgi:hypothetical protein